MIKTRRFEYTVRIPSTLNMTEIALDRWNSKESSSTTPALIHGERTFTYKELSSYVNRVGNAMKRLGVTPGQRVLIKQGNHYMYIVLNLAVIKIGAVSVPISTLFREREVEHVLRDAQPSLVIAPPDQLEQLITAAKRLETPPSFYPVTGTYDDLPSIEDLSKDEGEVLDAYPSNAEDTAFILYTSGTTAFPKGVEHAHRWLVALGDPNTEFVMNLRRGHRVTTPSEMTWMWPWGYCLWFPLYRGATIVIYEGRFDPQRTFSHLEKYEVTHFVGNPTIYRRMLAVDKAEEKFKLRLEAAFSSGETLAPEVFREWKRRFGCEIYDCMGQTEMHVFCATRPGSVKLGSMGKPLPSIPVEVVREDGTPCDEGEVGYLAVRGDFKGLTKGYVNLPEEWASKFKEKWYLTGDYAYLDEDGFLWYVSRVDDLIKSRGYLISPKEVEDVLQEHPAVLESAVVGVKDPELREKVKAYVVLKEGYSPSEELAREIREFTVRKIAPFKAPKEIAFIDSLPKTVTGKVMRRVLKTQAETGVEQASTFSF